MKRIVFLVLILSALLFGCADEKNSEEEPIVLSATSATPEAPEGVGASFVAKYQRELCDLNERCQVGLFPEGDACLSYIAVPPEEAYSYMVVDQGAAKECLEKIKKMSCEEAESIAFATYPEIFDLCSSAMHGAAGLGDPCESVLGCDVGFYCDMSQSCPGVCKISYPCENEKCNMRGYCDEEGYCQPKRQLGEPCENKLHCPLDTICKDGLCYAGREEGEDCSDEWCRVGLKCDHDVKLCRKVSIGLKLGEACDRYNLCGWGGECVEEDGQSLCVLRPNLNEKYELPTCHEN